MKDNNFKYQLIAIQALDKKYGFTPSPQQVKLLESDGEGTYILFRVGEHEYRCEDGEITNMEEQKKIEEAVSLYFGMFQEARKDAESLKKHCEEEIKSLKEKYQKRSNEQRFEIHRMKDRIRKLEPFVTELIEITRE